jgi:PIN domain nuclease of toxin-antitoxin system
MGEVRVLLDSHALLWWLDDDKRLPRRARATIASSRNEILVSVASVWEIGIKASLGKLSDALGAVPRLPSILVERGIQSLPIEAAHAIEAATLPRLHRDPFDRMIVAQSRLTGIPIMTNDRLVKAYEVQTIW